jgi:hypothetical protein
MQTMDRNTEVLVDYMTTNVTELWLMMEWLIMEWLNKKKACRSEDGVGKLLE